MHGSGELVKSRNGLDDDISNLFGNVCPLKNLRQFMIQTPTLCKIGDF